jgi:hypothetical protein
MVWPFGKKNFKCSVCGASFKTKEELDVHTKQAHPMPAATATPVTVRVYDSYVKTWFNVDPKTGQRTLAK